MLYISSIIITIILNFVSNARIKKYISNNINNVTYKEIGKYNLMSFKKSLKKSLVGIVLNLLPFGLNIVIAGLSVYASFKEDILENVVENRINNFGIDKLLKIYEHQKSLEDNCVKLDELTEKQIAKQRSLASEENGIRYIKEKIYNDIKASGEAITFLNEFEMHGDIELEPKERIKLLKEFRKSFVPDSKETIKPIKKMLKISRKIK